MIIRPFDREALKRQFDSGEPFRHLVIDDFLDPDFAQSVAASFPSFDEAQEKGFEFNFVQERRKVQISDSSDFPEPVARLNNALASASFLEDLEYITGIPNLEADPTLGGGGMHMTGPGGRLDVHVDFNYSEERSVFRRLNILVYLNPEWTEAYGGQVELWDRDVKKCHHRVTPQLNRCVIFETSEISYHGVCPVTPEAPSPRHSFAAYYYTKDAPEGWDGRSHGTIFRTRPDERMRRFVVVPTEQLLRKGREALRSLKHSIRGKNGQSK